MSLNLSFSLSQAFYIIFSFSAPHLKNKEAEISTGQSKITPPGITGTLLSGVFKPKSDKGSVITLVIIIPSLLRLEQIHPAPAFFAIPIH